MKIIVDDAIPFIKDRFPSRIEVVYLDGKEIVPEKVKDADALIVRTRTRCDSSLLKESKVRLIATATIGTDHIDIPWCEENGILVRSAPGCNAPGVAQYVFASLFSAGFNSERDVLGIVGHGNVGSVVADWASEMGIKTLISDAPKAAQKRKDQMSDGVKYVSLEEMLMESDAITLHVPLTYEGPYTTRGLIGRDEIGLMKPGVILVNSSRGGVVEENSLVKAIKTGKVRAIIDTWENEPYINRKMLDLVVSGTPHIAGYSEEGKKRATRMVLESLIEEFNMPVDLSGLDCQPQENKAISRALIEKSYNPQKDWNELRKNPEEFEKLRNNYHYRHEPLFV